MGQSAFLYSPKFEGKISLPLENNERSCLERQDLVLNCNIADNTAVLLFIILLSRVFDCGRRCDGKE